jgi:hypothetical protein
LVNEPIKSAENEAGLKLPLHNGLVLEVWLKTSFLDKKSFPKEATDLEGISHPLQALVWFHSKNFLANKIVCLLKHAVMHST